MRKILKLLTSKTTFFALILLAQLILLFGIVFLLATDGYIGLYVNFFFNFVSMLIVVYILSKNSNINYKISWLILVLAFPVFGTFFYLFYHKNNVKKKDIKRYNEFAIKRLEFITDDIDASSNREIKYLNKSGWKNYKNTESVFFNSGNEMLDSLLIDLELATTFIFLEYFIIAKGKMFDSIMNILIKKASEGVLVKLIYDDFGCADRLPFNFIKKMKAHNIEVVAFNPMRLHINFAMNYRTHRKIVVIDNKYAYTGGVNIGDEYINAIKKFGYWHDAAIKITGNAVWGLTISFLENWNFTSKNKLAYSDFYIEHKAKSDGIVIPFSETPIDNNQTARDVFLLLINDAKTEILISTPYLIIDNEIYTALKLAASSGVKIKIIIPNVPDKKIVYSVTLSYAKDLIDVGAEIYKYQPGFIHSKLMLIDKKKAVVGTTNLDFRSLYLHFENNVYLYNTKTIKSIDEYFVNTLKKSKLSTKDDVYKKGLTRRFFRGILKSFSPIL